MQTLAVGKSYCLRLPDGRALGHVRITWRDEPWAGGPFSPLGAFEEVRPLFERESELRRDQIIPLWEQAADAIEALHVQVVEEGEAASHSGLRLYVDGDEASLGTPLSGN